MKLEDILRAECLNRIRIKSISIHIFFIVPERGWGAEEQVRVCRDCYGPLATKAMRSKSSGNLSETANMNGINPSNRQVSSEKQNEVQVRR